MNACFLIEHFNLFPLVIFTAFKFKYIVCVNWSTMDYMRANKFDGDVRLFLLFLIFVILMTIHEEFPQLYVCSKICTSFGKWVEIFDNFTLRYRMTSLHPQKMCNKTWQFLSFKLIIFSTNFYRI